MTIKSMLTNYVKMNGYENLADYYEQKGEAGIRSLSDMIYLNPESGLKNNDNPYSDRESPTGADIAGSGMTEQKVYATIQDILENAEPEPEPELPTPSTNPDMSYDLAYSIVDNPEETIGYYPADDDYDSTGTYDQAQKLLKGLYDSGQITVDQLPEGERRARGMELYNNGEYDEAIEIFKTMPNDNMSQNLMRKAIDKKEALARLESYEGNEHSYY